MVLGKKHKHDDGTEHSHANGDIYHEHGKKGKCVCTPEYGNHRCTAYEKQKRYKMLTKYINHQL